MPIVSPREKISLIIRVTVLINVFSMNESNPAQRLYEAIPWLGIFRVGRSEKLRPVFKRDSFLVVGRVVASYDFSNSNSKFVFYDHDFGARD